MRRSLTSAIFIAALLFECHARSAALPVGNPEDRSLEQEAFTSLLTDEATDNGLSDADLATATKARVPRVIVVATNPSLWRDLQLLHNGLSAYKRTADDYSQGPDHRDNAQQLSIPILRRDTMRCMVGRVYRPCWEV